MNRGGTAYTFFSNESLEINEEIYATQFNVNNELKPNLIGSWSLDFDGITKTMVLEEIKQQSSSDYIDSVSVPTDILGPRGVKNSMDVQRAVSQQKKAGYPYQELMNDTLWISNFEYEHFIAHELTTRACANIKNPKYMKDHTKHSVSSINGDKKEAEESCQRVINYIEVNVDKICKEGGRGKIIKTPCKIQLMPNGQYLAIATIKISWEKDAHASEIIGKQETS